MITRIGLIATAQVKSGYSTRTSCTTNVSVHSITDDDDLKDVDEDSHDRDSAVASSHSGGSQKNVNGEKPKHVQGNEAIEDAHLMLDAMWSKLVLYRLLLVVHLSFLLWWKTLLIHLSCQIMWGERNIRRERTPGDVAW
jgi:hypothetical protein